jgi:GTP cyclohydrolase I
VTNVAVDVDKAALAIESLLQALGVDEGEHTANTPARVARAWADAVAGYETDPAVHLDRVFPSPDDPGLIVVSGIRVLSRCAHHLLPIVGYATVAYRGSPGTPIVGLSKLARVVEGFARRLQIQERLGYQVAYTVCTKLRVDGAACVITAEHGCMTLRGVQQPGARTTTVAAVGTWHQGGLYERSDLEQVMHEHHACQLSH